jgi:anti-sigma regulatory factor (Ser/Thr protein kinase)
MGMDAMDARAPAWDRSAADDFVHPALLYRGLEDYLSGTLPFIRAGLDSKEPVAVAVPGPNLAVLRSELGDDADRVRLLDMARVGRNPGRIIPGVLRSFADTHPEGRVRIIGEPIWPGRTEVEYPACVQHEALINLAFGGRAVTILCPYDAERLPAQVLADAEATHPVLETGGRRWASTVYAPQRIIDAHNSPLPRPPGVPWSGFASQTLIEPRRAAVAEALRAGLPADRIADLELAVSELATNSVVHGGGCGEFAVWCEDGRLVLEVRDRGRLADSLAGRLPAAPASPGGRGLLIVNLVADLVRVHCGVEGTAIRAWFDL